MGGWCVQACQARLIGVFGVLEGAASRADFWTGPGRQRASLEPGSHHSISAGERQADASGIAGMPSLVSQHRRSVILHRSSSGRLRNREEFWPGVTDGISALLPSARAASEPGRRTLICCDRLSLPRTAAATGIAHACALALYLSSTGSVIHACRC